MEQKYAVNYSFIHDTQYFNQNPHILLENKATTSQTQTTDEKISSNKKSVTFRDHVHENQRKKDKDKEIRLQEEVNKREKQRKQKKKTITKPKKPPLVYQSTLEYGEEASVGNESPSPLSKSLEEVMERQNQSYQKFPEPQSKYNHYFKFPLNSSQRQDMLSMAQYEPLNLTNLYNYNSPNRPHMSYQQYKAYEKYEKEKQELDNLYALRRWEKNKIDQFEQHKRLSQIERQSTYISASLSPSVEGHSWWRRSASPDSSGSYVRMWEIIIKIVIGLIGVWAIWIMLSILPESDPARPPFANEGNDSGFNIANIGVVVLLVFMVGFGLIYGDGAHKSPVFWISWMMFVICCYQAIRDVTEHDGHIDARRYDYKHDIDDDDDYYSDPYYEYNHVPVPVPVPPPVDIYVSEAEIMNEIYEEELEEKLEKDIDDCDGVFGSLWIRYGVDIILWLSFLCCLSLFFPRKRTGFIVMLSITVSIIFGVFRFAENTISKQLNMNHNEIMELCWYYLLWLIVPLLIISIICVHIMRCLNIKNSIYYIGKLVLIIIVLFAMYYDKILTVQFMIISYF
eukprot:552636_1